MAAGNVMGNYILHDVAIITLTCLVSQRYTTILLLSLRWFAGSIHQLSAKFWLFPAKRLREMRVCGAVNHSWLVLAFFSYQPAASIE